MVSQHVDGRIAESASTLGSRITANASLTDQVVAAVRVMIRSGALAPGRLYSAYQLASDLGVSRSPVREALLRLSEADMVSFERNRGFRVVLPNPRNIAEIFGLRLAIEVAAARRAAATATRELRSSLVAQLTLMERSAELSSEVQFFAQDQEFHDMILEHAGNARAAAMVRGLRDTVRVLGASTAQHKRTLEEIGREHEPVVQAICAGDPQAAGDAMHSHIERTGMLLLQQAIDEQGTGGSATELWDGSVY